MSARAVSKWGWIACGLWAGLILYACSDSTSPPVDRIPRVDFHPDADTVVIHLDSDTLLAVMIENVPEAEVVFRHGEDILGTANEYRFFAERIEDKVLTASVTIPDETLEHTWTIRIEVDETDQPPAVNDLALSHDPAPGSIVVSWTRPAVGTAPRDLDFYQVGIRYGGALTAENWDSAIIIDEVPHVPGHIGYMRHYDDDVQPELLPGERLWLAVRAVDEAGLLSPVGDVFDIELTYEYFLEGTVLSEVSEPLQGILVSYGCPTCKELTDAAGAFSIGPLRSIDKYVLTISDDGIGIPGIGAYHDYVTDSLGVDTELPLDLYLIRSWPLDGGCGGHYAGDFLSFLRQMTRTAQEYTIRPNTQLLKWREYPLTIHIEQTMNSFEEFAMDSLADLAVQEWNDKLGEPFFVEVDTPAEAVIDMVFLETSPGDPHGWVALVDPGPPHQINTAIPNKAKVFIKKNFGAEHRQYALEVMLHELGHALGLGGHSDCGPLIHIMYFNPQGIIDARWPESPINDDEAAAVRAVRYLPQGIEMEDFSSD